METSHISKSVEPTEFLFSQTEFLSLLVKRQNGTTTLENCLEVSSIVKHTSNPMTQQR